MPGSKTTMFLRAKEAIRLHPDWDDEQVAAYADIRKFDMDIVQTARRDSEVDRQEAATRDPGTGRG